jgi:hypothetical protein
MALTHEIIDLQTIGTEFERLGLTVPEPVARTLAVYREVTAVATADPLAELRASVANATVEPDTIGAELDAAAVALARKDQGHTISTSLSGAFNQAARLLAVHQGDAMITALRPTFDQAVGQFADAVDLLGPNPEPAMIRGAGPKTALAFGTFDEAKGTLAHVHRARTRLAGLGYAPTHRQQCGVWYLEGPPAMLEEANDVYRQAHGDKFAAMLAAGLTLRLNTAAESDALVQADQQARAQVAAEAAEAARVENEAEVARVRKPWDELAQLGAERSNPKTKAKA